MNHYSRSEEANQRRERIGARGHEGTRVEVLAAEFGLSRATVHQHIARYRKRHGIDSPRAAKKRRIDAPMAPFSKQRAKKIRGNQHWCGDIGRVAIETARCVCGVVVPMAQLDRHQADPVRCELARRAA